MQKNAVSLRTVFVALVVFLGMTAILLNCTAKSARFKDGNAFQSSMIWVPDNYTTIQAAVNAASVGGTIVVRPGLYWENVKVNKTVTLIGKDYPIIEGNGSISYWGDACIVILADNVTVNGFVLQDTGVFREADGGMGLFASYCNISGNIFRFSRGGITMSTGSHDDMIVGNIFENMQGKAIGCDGYNILVRDNVITSSGAGIIVAYPQNTLINNTIINAEDYAILLNAYLITMKNNKIVGCEYGFGTVELLLSQLINDIDATNTIDGKPIYYWINQSNANVPSDAGYVALINSTNIVAENLDLRKNGQGVFVAYSNNCTVRDCNITENEKGIFILNSNNTILHHNNIINNSLQCEATSPTLWDDGYPSGGNYWSNYNGTDQFSGAYQNETGSDGIIDTPYSIDANNQDNYPFPGPISLFDVGNWNGTQRKIHVVSNSTLSAFTLNETEKTIKFNVTGESGLGFCRATIPNIIVQNLWQNNYAVLVDNQPPLEMRNWTDSENTYMYFTYQHSQHEITIIPESSATAILIPILTIAATGITLFKRKAENRTATHD
jgi:parallel beta-helix repeat protein